MAAQADESPRAAVRPEARRGYDGIPAGPCVSAIEPENHHLIDKVTPHRTMLQKMMA
jgi:hypothetical protein